MWPLFALTRFNVQVNVIHIMGQLKVILKKNIQNNARREQSVNNYSKQ